MRNECNIIKDILPLYSEDMVSEDTALFVEDHLKNCEACKNELKNIKETYGAEPTVSDTAKKCAVPLKKLKKRWRKRTVILIAVTSVITALLVLSASYFIGSGLVKRNDVVLAYYFVSEDNKTITLCTTLPTSMGYIQRI